MLLLMLVLLVLMIQDYFKHKHVMEIPSFSMATDLKTSKIKYFSLLDNKIP